MQAKHLHGALLTPNPNQLGRISARRCRQHEYLSHCGSGSEYLRTADGQCLLVPWWGPTHPLYGRSHADHRFLGHVHLLALTQQGRSTIGQPGGREMHLARIDGIQIADAGVLRTFTTHIGPGWDRRTMIAYGARDDSGWLSCWVLLDDGLRPLRLQFPGCVPKIDDIRKATGLTERTRAAVETEFRQLPSIAGEPWSWAT